MQLKINNYKINQNNLNELTYINDKKEVAKKTDQQSAPTRKKDELVLSEEAKKLLENKNKINPGDSRFKPLFERYGIDTTHELSLLIYIDGKVVVTNNHPDKGKIEALLNSDNELAKAIKMSLGASFYTENI
ncbi:MAG TPA: hypothetical protein PK887_03520 [Ignavibacteriales bacterium]|jgi:hypothetical protein|nr:hypothetical protein [Ignavibacteriales bacterium]